MPKRPRKKATRTRQPRHRKPHLDMIRGVAQSLREREAAQTRGINGEEEDLRESRDIKHREPSDERR